MTEPVRPVWIDALAPGRAAWVPVKVQGGGAIACWTYRIELDPYRGPRPHSLTGDCRKGSGLVTGPDGSMSCAEVEVVRRLRAAGHPDAGWLATCGAGAWSGFQRPRSRIRGELARAFPGMTLGIPASGSGAPDVAALGGGEPIFVECKGSEPLQANQLAWLRAVLPPDEWSRSFVVVMRGASGVAGPTEIRATPATTVAPTPTLGALPPRATVRSGVHEDVDSSRRPPPAQGACQFLTKAGRPCQIPGRYWRYGRWSCSRNHTPDGDSA